MWTLAGMDARATSVNVLASRMSRNGEMFGSEEMTEDKMTPAEEVLVSEEGSTFNTVPNQRCWSVKRTLHFTFQLTIVFLHSPRRGHEHRFRRETGLLLPLDVFPSDHINLRHLMGKNRIHHNLSTRRYTSC